MASTAYNDLYQLTPDNQGISDLRELLTLTILQNGLLDEVLDINFGVRNGKIIGGIGEFGLVGEKAPICSPTFNATRLSTQEKVWDLGSFVVKERLCADDFLETVAKFSLKTGNEVADLTGTDLMNLIVEPHLQKAIERALWRVLWFGDLYAENVDDSGLITDGVDTKFFTTCDGLFKRLMNAAPSGSFRRVNIAANAQTTYAAQKAGIRVSGVATGVFDSLIYEADMRLRQQSDRFILCTQSMADALAIDIKTNNRGSDLHWESLFGGLVYATRYNEERIIALPIWDQMIAAFNNTGTKLFAPHRALFATKSNLLVGVEGKQFPTDLSVWFSQDDQAVKILARENLGTMIWEDDLIQFAY